MTNTINQNFGLPDFSRVGRQGGKKTAGKSHPNHGTAPGGGKDFDLMLSEKGKSLTDIEGMIPKQPQVQNNLGGAVTAEEQNLSAKAKDYLAKLRAEYGDYGFVVADNVENPLDLPGIKDKGYSVVLSSAEIERMAEDEEYAAGVMQKVEGAVKQINDIEAQGKLGEGVSFRRLAIAFDNDGNTKLFAELERMSAEQRERLEAAREKRAEAKKLHSYEENHAPRSRPTVPSWQEISLSFKASFSHNISAEQAVGLLQDDNGGKTSAIDAASGYRAFYGSTATWNFELNATIKTATLGGQPLGGHRSHGIHGGYNRHHGVHGTAISAAGRTLGAQSPQTVRIEANSAEELLEKAGSIDWSSTARVLDAPKNGGLLSEAQLKEATV